MQTYRVGIIGLGRMGSTIDDEGHSPLPYSVASAARASDRLELVAGCDLNADRREAFGQRWGVDRLFEDFRQMVEAEKPDIVAICTTATGLPKPGNEAPDTDFRGDSHADLAVACSDLGVPMLYVEKAIACSMRRADEVRDTVQRNGTLFNSGVLRRFDNRYDIVRDAVLNGEIGEPRAVVHYAASSLMHGHIHSIDTLSWLLGDPTITHVRGELDPRDYTIENSFIPYDPRATYQLRFEGGVEAWSVPAAGWEFEVIGSQGTVRSLNNGAGACLRKATTSEGRRPGWRDTALPEIKPKSTVVSCLEDLIEARETGRETRGHVAVTHDITEACLAVAESHRLGGSWVELPIEDRGLYVFHV